MYKKSSIWIYPLIMGIIIILTNSCGKDEDESSIKDADGNVYHAVTIGTQVWLVENLKTTKYNDGTIIPNVSNSDEWSNLSTGAYCNYDNVESKANTYGRLYNWYAVETGKLAPIGWHVATDAEWTTLIDFMGGDSVAGDKLKETGTTHWGSPNTSATNESGFTALPGGYRFNNGLFFDLGKWGQWWSSTEDFSWTSWLRSMTYNYNGVYRNSYPKEIGYSVRCVKD